MPTGIASSDRMASSYQDVLSRELSEHVGLVLPCGWTLTSLVEVELVYAVFEGSGPKGERGHVKLLHPFLVGEPDYEARFDLEGRIANTVPSPAGLQVFSVGETEDGIPYLVGEDVQAEGAGARFTGKLPLEPDFACKIVECFAAGVAPFHEGGIVHRALNPSSLLVLNDNQIRISNFGTCAIKGEDERAISPTLLGPASYVSPELALQKSASPASDVFSLGAFLFWLLTGESLRTQPTRELQLVSAATTPPRSISDVMPALPDDLCAVIDKAIAYKDTDRFQTAAEFRDALAPIIARGTSLRREVADRADGRNWVLSRISKTATEDGGKWGEQMRAISSCLHAVFSPPGEVDPDLVPGIVKTAARVIDRIVSDSETQTLVLEIFPDSIECEGNVLLPDLPEPAYWLFAQGIRRITFNPGLAEAAFRDFMRGMGDAYVDRERFRERLEPGARIHVVRGATLERLLPELGATAITEQLYELEDDARAALMRDGRNSASRFEPATTAEIDGHRTVSMPLDRPALASFAASLRVKASHWKGRFPLVLSAALDDSLSHGDVESVVEPLNLLVSNWLTSGRIPRALAFYNGLVDATAGKKRQSELLKRVFGPTEIKTVLEQLAENPVLDEDALGGLIGLIESQAQSALPLLTEALETIEDSPILVPLVSLVGRLIGDRAEDLGSLLQNASQRVVLPLLKTLDDLESGNVLLALRRACKNPDPFVAAAALEQRLRMGDRDAWRELDRLLEDQDETTRLDALRLIRTHEVKSLSQRLASRINDMGFASLSEEERGLTLRALGAVDPKMAERVAIELVKRKNLTGAKERDTLRLQAVGMLGRVAKSKEARTVLNQIAKSRWFTSKELQEMAKESLSTLESIDFDADRET